MNSFNETMLNNTTFGTWILSSLVFVSEHVPYTILCFLGTLIGIFGNLLIMIAILMDKKLRTMTNILVFNLALSDLLISGIVDQFTGIGIIVGKKFFDERFLLCQFIAAICLVSCETSLVSIGFLAINRYTKICHKNHYNKIFTKPKTIFYCIICWMIGALITFPNILGWGGFYYDLKTMSCVWNRLASLSYSIFFPMSSIVIPCVIILILYIRIFLFVRQSRRKVSSNHDKNDKKSTSMNKSLKLAKGLFFSFMAFTLCWLPYGAIVMLDFEDKLPKEAIQFSMLLAHLNSGLNPVLYSIYNSQFQKAFKNLFRIICFNKILNEKSKTGVGNMTYTMQKNMHSAASK